MAQTFEREYELEGEGGTLVLRQLEEGDVNCVVWDAALVLAKYLEARCARQPGWLAAQRVVELGAGVGCVGLVAACCGANVTLTDQPKALPLLDQNAETNAALLQSLNGKVRSKSVDWNVDTDEPPCDILLLADCVYYQESISPLIRTMVQLSTANTEILMSQEDRSYSEIQTATWNEFCTEVEKSFTITIIPKAEQHEEYSSPDIRLLRLTKKL